MPRRREFTRDQKAAIARRATVQGTIFCEGCGLAVTRFEIDHTIPDALFLDKSRKLTIEDGKLLGIECCHRGPDGKTAKDVKAIAKSKRVEAKHQRIVDKPRPIQGKPFPTTTKAARRKKKAADRLPVPRPKHLFERSR